MLKFQEKYRSTVLQELKYGEFGRHIPKDIIIIVRDQYEYIKSCLESLVAVTKDYHLYIWDNGSAKQTEDFLTEFRLKNDNVSVIRTEENIGFIEPNNTLAQFGHNPYIILLNSDTFVYPNWDILQIGFLEQNPVAQVGYFGGLLKENGIGGDSGEAIGYNTDYVSGACCCFSRETFEKFGLFDAQNLVFAYGEDADFSLRLKEAGKQIYVLHVELVEHFGNKTINQVRKERDVVSSFNLNHEYIRKRWKTYLEKDRINANR